MDADTAKLEICGKEDCLEKAVLTMRIDTDEGTEFDCFCFNHLPDAAKYITMIYDENRGEESPKE